MDRYPGAGVWILGVITADGVLLRGQGSEGRFRL